MMVNDSDNDNLKGGAMSLDVHKVLADGRCSQLASEGGTMRLETLVELKFVSSNCSSLSSY